MTTEEMIKENNALLNVLLRNQATLTAYMQKIISSESGEIISVDDEKWLVNENAASIYKILVEEVKARKAR